MRQYEPDLRRIAPTTEEGDQQESSSSPNRWPPTEPHSDCTGRSPGMTMPEAVSAWPESAQAHTARSTRSRCDRYTCQPGNRCVEHRPGADPVHFSKIFGEVIQHARGERA